MPDFFYQFKYVAFIGFPDSGFRSSDYFPVITWIFVYILGYFLWRIIKQYGKENIFGQRVYFLDFLGRHSLLITPELGSMVWLGCVLTEAELEPDRNTLGLVWRYLASHGEQLRETPMCLCRKIVRWSGQPLSLGKLLTCLDIFADVGLISVQRLHKTLTIELLPCQQKADLNTSKTMQILMAAIEQ